MAPQPRSVQPVLLAQVGMQAAYRFAQELRELRLLPNYTAVLQALGTSAGISQLLSSAAR